MRGLAHIGRWRRASAVALMALERAALATASTLAEIDDLLATLDHDAPYPGAVAEGQRGRAGTPKRPALPDRWLETREMDGDDARTLAEAELDTSGG